MLWRARQFNFEFPGPALLMGVVNVTPDSFSDGGRFLDPDVAIAHARALVAEGADIVDIGGESTRPGAQPVGEAEELRRVLPVIEGLRGQVPVPISIDTTKPAVARAALEAGASIVNDIAGHRKDTAMWQLIAASGAGYVLMHMKGTPQTMQAQAVYNDVTSEVNEFFGERLDRLAATGVRPEQVVLDVGIGFAKTTEDNLQLLANLRIFRKWDRPILVGVSRKAFIGALAGPTDPTARLPGSLACACWARTAGADIVRVHDVAATKQALQMTEQILKRTK